MRRLANLIGVGLVMMLVPAAPVSAQSAEAWLTVDPTEFGQGQTIGLSASFGALMPEYYGYVVGWEAALYISGTNGYDSGVVDADQWLDECFYYGGWYCEGGGQLYFDPWLNGPGSDDVPGQTMEATSYEAYGIAVFYVAECLEFCWANPWVVEAFSQTGLAVPQQQPPCTGERATIRQQYIAGNHPFVPECSDFTQVVPYPSHYGFNLCNQDGDFSWAILRDHMVGNVYCVSTNYGEARPLTSGYRNPAAQLRISPGSPFGRHTYGDAADLDTPNHPDNVMWNELRHLSKNIGCGFACVEPRNISPNHIHMDYRPTCPADW